MKSSAIPRLDAERLWQTYWATRSRSLALTATLTPEDHNVQSMPDASPTKWHLAHTTWFFETLVLMAHLPGYTPYSPVFSYLYNSYYEALGPRHARPERGLLSRPALDEVRQYRMHVDGRMRQLLESAPDHLLDEILTTITLGIHHEQQHQELMLTDILHAFWRNPTRPAYLPTPANDTNRVGALVQAPKPESGAMHWLQMAGGSVEIGHQPRNLPFDFSFDNERPRHNVLLAPFEIADRLVTNGEFADFVADGGYARPEFWLADGWAHVQREGWQAPAYWIAPPDEPNSFGPSDGWRVFGLWGVQPMDLSAPVTHLSFFEAAAYAEWAGARLPTEFEWEAAFGTPGLRQMTCTAWQWTRSAYAPYPGFRPMEGAAAEYNGKFMVGQQVLRGSSIATPSGHARPTYRNFFPPAARWQFSGVRLARDIHD